MASNSVKLEGQCACGSVSYRSTASAEHLDFCYCKICQQIGGGPFVAWIGILKAALAWQGPIRSFVVNDLATRACCEKCGSTMTIQYHCYPEKTHVAAGSVSSGHETLPSPGMHIWISRKPAWYSIPSDGLLRYEEFDPEFDQVQRDFMATDLRATVMDGIQKV
ncbi:hypothetical protein LTR42_005941 [Elasticomyces elasticus]|nr:hypothetical protein LTR42_005941 [Elasticomyces elasticus]